ncbi:MAG: Xaa-Pro peptidase family protein [Phycisphaerales bacterium]|nr:Xaa-Pro peptidase family protein [Phycisphaerales bacterium]MCI0674265.1 Xaa-Pro peptidase family protein [Phycisphaerales bacterium]
MRTATASVSAPSIVAEKVTQAVALLSELEIDCWLTFVRETTETGDPILPLILGQPLTWQSALILTRHSDSGAGERIAIVGKYEDQAVKASGGGDVWTKVLPYVQSIRSPLATTLARLNPKQIAINYSTDDVKADGLSHGMMLLLSKYLSGTPFAERLISAAEIIRALRGRKTPGEIDRIKAAIHVTDEIFQLVAQNVEVGFSERDVSELMHRELSERSIDTAWERTQCPIVTTGPHSMLGHGLPSFELTVAPGNIFHLDFGVRMNDYCSDIQRAWYVPRPGENKPPPAVQRAFDTIVNAIQTAFKTLRPGVECWTVDAAARKVITDAGYPEYQHATGHQVGRAAHDGGGVLGPKWERYGKTPLYTVEPGNVFTLELGIDNVDNRGYLGLEEMVLVTDRGCQWLTNPQTSLPLL